MTESAQTTEIKLETEEATRKPFDVTAVKITLQNVDLVAKWCNGEIGEESYKMLGTWTKLPCVKVPGNGASKGQKVTALLGQYVVKHNSSFRIYRADQFKATFDVKPKARETVEETPAFQKGDWVRVTNGSSRYFEQAGQVYALAESVSPGFADGLIGVDFGTDHLAEDDSVAPFYPSELEPYDNAQVQ